MPFLGSSDHFSLGSKWFWYLQKDKMYTLGERAPVGLEMVPEEPKMAPKTLLGPFGPILVYFFLGPGPKFFKVLLGQNRPGNFFPKKITLFRLPDGLGPSETQN